MSLWLIKATNVLSAELHDPCTFSDFLLPRQQALLGAVGTLASSKSPPLLKSHSLSTSSSLFAQVPSLWDLQCYLHFLCPWTFSSLSLLHICLRGDSSSQCAPNRLLNAPCPVQMSPPGKGLQNYSCLCWADTVLFFFIELKENFNSSSQSFMFPTPVFPENKPGREPWSAVSAPVLSSLLLQQSTDLSSSQSQFLHRYLDLIPSCLSKGLAPLGRSSSCTNLQPLPYTWISLK